MAAGRLGLECTPSELQMHDPHPGKLRLHPENKVPLNTNNFNSEVKQKYHSAVDVPFTSLSFSADNKHLWSHENTIC